MTENNNEGAEFDEENVDQENDNSTDSPAENNDTEDTDSPDREGNSQEDPDKDKPFHEHPAWKDREKKWDDRFNDQESRHQEDLRKIREEFGGARKDNAGQSKIPAWFGGNQEQWDAYRVDRDTEIKEAEERAVKRITQSRDTEEKAVANATEYMQSELAAIQSDKTLNPTGAKIDVNKLVQFAIDNYLVDPKGNWDYRKAFKFMKPASTTTITPDRKKIAGNTGSESKETTQKNYKTSKDFRQNKPW